MEKFSLAIVKNPFNRVGKDISALEYTGQGIEDLVQMYAAEGMTFVVSVNGNVMPREQWDSYTIKSGDFLLLMPSVEGGGTNDRMFAQIAVMAIGFAVAGPAGGGLAKAIGIGSQAFWSAMTMTAVNMLGGLAINKWMPLEKPEEVKSAYTWNPQPTQRAGLPIPYWYGEYVVKNPNILVSFIDKISLQDQYFNGLLGFGMGPIASLSEIKLNDSEIDNFSEANYTTRLGYLQQIRNSIIKNTKTTVAIPNGELKTPRLYDDATTDPDNITITPIYYTTSADDFDALEFNFSAPNGIWAYDGNDFRWSAEFITIWVRRYGTTNWEVVNSGLKYGDFSPATDHARGWVLAEFDINNQFTHGNKTLLLKGDIIQWQDFHWVGPIGTRYYSSTHLAIPFDCSLAITSPNTKDPVYKTVKYTVPEGEKGVYEIAVFRHTMGPSSYVKEKTIYDGDIVVWDSVNFVYGDTNGDKFIYPKLAYTAIRANANEALSNGFSFQAKLKGRLVQQWDETNSRWVFGYSNNPAWVCYDILTQPVVRDLQIFNYFGTVYHCNTTFTWRSIDHIGETLAQKRAYLLQYCEEVTGIAANPITEGKQYIGRAAVEYVDGVPIFVDTMYTTPIRYDGLSRAKVDHVKFYEWAQFCDTLVETYSGSGVMEKEFTFNGGFDTAGTTWEAALEVAASARASLFWVGQKLTLFIDTTRDRTQLFTIGNINLDSVTEVYLPIKDRLGGVEVGYVNAANNYEKDTFLLVDRGSLNKNNISEVTLTGTTSATQAWRQAAYILLQNKYLKRTVKFSADIDAIGCTIGDRIGVQTPMRYLAEGGRLVSNTIASVTLDREVTLGVGKTYTLTLKNALTDILYEREVTNIAGDHSVITFTENIPLDIGEYAIWSITEEGYSVKDYAVIDISQSSEQQFEITAIEYNPLVYSGDPDLISFKSEPPTDDTDPLFEDITVVSFQETNTYFEGEPAKNLQISFKAPETSYYVSTNVYSSSDDLVFTLVGNTINEFIGLGGVTLGATYYFKLAMINSLGQEQALGDISSFSYTVSNTFEELDVTLANAVANVRLKDAPGTEFSGLDCRLIWDSPTNYHANQNFYRYVVKIYETNDVLRSTHYVYINEFTYTYAMNVADGIEPSFKVGVYAESRTSNTSTEQVISITHASPSAPTSLTATPDLASIRLTIGGF